MMMRLLFLGWAALFTLTTAVAYGGPLYMEAGDTGALLATAQDVGPGVDTITGNIAFDGDIDMFKVIFDAPGMITFETRSERSGGAHWSTRICSCSTAPAIRSRGVMMMRIPIRAFPVASL